MTLVSVDGEAFFVEQGDDVREVLTKLNFSSCRAVFVRDEIQRLVGVITDGDVRRGLLSGNTMSSLASEVMNRNFISVSEGTRVDSLLKIMEKEQISQLPEVSSDGKCLRIHVKRTDLSSGMKSNWVVIMAGGRGERLRPLTDTTPKPLMKVGNETLIDSVISRCSTAGFRKFFVSINYLGEQIEEHLGHQKDSRIDIEFLKEQKRLGTAGALQLLPEKPVEPLLVMNADILHEVDLTKLLEFHVDKEASMTIASRIYETKIPFGVIESDGDVVTGIVEKPTISHLVNAGIYVVSPSILELVDRDSYMDMPFLIEQAMLNGHKVVPFPVHERWLDVGTFESLEIANHEARSKP